MKQKKFRSLLNVGAFSLAALFTGNGFAADKELLDALLKNGAITQSQHSALIKQAAGQGDGDALLDVLLKNGVVSKSQLSKYAAPAKPKEVTVEKDSASVKLGDKGLEFETADGNFKAAIGGRLQLDQQVNWNETPRNLNSLPTDLNDGFGIRRSRVHLTGTLYKDFDYKFEYDFSKGNGTVAAGITDAYVTYTHFKPFSLTIGQFKEPFSLDSVTSNRFLTFIERPLAGNAFVEGPNPYRLGISAEGYDTRWTGRAAFQAESIGAGGNNTAAGTNGNTNRNGTSGDTSYNAVGRATFLPFYNSATELLHVGAAGAYTSINNTCSSTSKVCNPGDAVTSALSFATAPGTNVDRSSWLSTGGLTGGGKELDHYVRFGGELAGVYGPFSFQSEYIRTQLSGLGYSANDELDGYYAFGSYFLTGESRAYDTKKGAFGRQKPKKNFDFNGGLGAWEIAARYDTIDMNTANVKGGRLANGTVALNWYLNPHVRFMANYMHVFDTTTIRGSSSISKYDGLNPDVLEFRTQLDW